MSLHRKWIMASSFALSIGLTGCGGSGGGGQVVSTPTPPPALAPTPPPAPPVPPPPVLPPPPGLSQQGDFATTGISFGFTSGSNGRILGSVSPDTGSNVQIRYLASEQTYEVLLPGLALGRVDATAKGTNFTGGEGSVVRNGNIPGTQQAIITLPEQPSPLYPAGPLYSELVLTYTRFGIWGSGVPSEPGPHTGGYFAYGVPSAKGTVPTSGSGTYNAAIAGMTVDGGYPVGGQAQLLFDFGAGTLSGHMQPILGPNGSPWDYDIHVDLGRYDFVQTVYSSGSTSFSGKFNVPGSTAPSFFEGQFTGPQAAELMARWMAPYRNPSTQQWSTMLGIWVGKKD